MKYLLIWLLFFLCSCKIHAPGAPIHAPLYIVDGRICKGHANPTKTLQPHQILSIEVIPDKKAVEKYGPKAKNGAILIFLKHEKYCPDGPKDTVACWYDSSGIRVKGYAIVRQNLCNLPSDSIYHDNQLKNLGYWVYAVVADRKARVHIPGAIAYACKD